MFQTSFNHWLQSFESEGLTFFMRGISFLGEIYPVMLICLIIIGGIHFRKGWLLLNIVAFTTFLTVWAKESIDFPRPIAVDASLMSLSGEQTTIDYSNLQPTRFFALFPAELLKITRKSEIGRHGFPSGHTSGQIAIWLGLALLFRKKWLAIWAVAFIVLTMISRMYLGVHYLGDVLGGLVLGTLTTAGIYYLGIMATQKRGKLLLFFSFMIFIPLLIMNHSGIWQASLLLGVNTVYYFVSRKKNHELSPKIWSRVFSATLLILLFMSCFLTAKILFADGLSEFFTIITYLVGVLVFLLQLTIAQKASWIKINPLNNS